MKRLLSLMLLFSLLTFLPAQAETWFPDTTGTFIHRDPFCLERTLSLESYILPSLQYTSRDVIRTEGAYAICPHCDVPSVEIPAESELYYNPDGGTKLHHDPECRSVSEKYHPLTNIKDAEGPIPQGTCNFCGPRFMYSPADNRIWGASMEDKALFLPGVWTLPSADAISPEAAADIARNWAAQHLPDDIYTVCPMHYDYGLDISDQRETYKVLITTALQEPVRLLRIDAITGEIYAVARPAEHLDD